MTELNKYSIFGSGNLVVDIGTWDNIDPSRIFASSGAKVIAVDKYQKMTEFYDKIKDAVSRGEIDSEVACRIYPVKTDANCLPFRDGSVDCILMCYSTSWLQQFGSEILNIYAEVRRVLKDEGVVIILEPTVERIKEQELLLKTQMKTRREGLVLIGSKINSSYFQEI